MKLPRRWVRRLLWLAGFGCLWINVFDDPPLRTGPYVQNVTGMAATVAVICAEPAARSLEVFDVEGVRVAEQQADARRRHALRVTGLKPGQRYRYVLRAPDGGEESGAFRTAPIGDAEPVRFAFCGDSGDQPWWVWLQRTPILHLPARWQMLPTKSAVTAVGAAMAAYGPDFALHLGDVIYPKGLHAHYSSGFFRPFGELIRNSAFFPVLGNHDVMNAGGQQILSNFHLPTNRITGDERSYSFAYGPVRVIAIDCNTHLSPDRDHYQEGHPTSEYLLEQLRTCAEPWIVVASHFPMRSASRQKNRADLLGGLLPQLRDYHVSLYLSGHDHCYQRFGPSETLPMPLVVSGGGGKRLYDLSENPRDRVGAKALAKAHHWCSAEVDGGRFEVVARSIDGTELDRFEVALPEGGALADLRRRNPARAARIAGLAVPR
ncbi:MAG: metallophosphoesterase [Planctomycetota bacterium]